VFITAYSDHAIEAITERAGADVGYFVKPFVSDEMRQLATKLVIEWNKAREIESLVRAVATLRGERRDLTRLVEHLLREICMWLETDSAALLRRTREGRFAFDLGVGTLAVAEAPAVRAVIERLNNGLEVREGPTLTTLPDGTSLLPVHEFGVAIALAGRTRITPDRRYLLEVFLENAAFALRNNDIAARLAEAERLASVGRAVGFIVHDVRNPLSVAQMLSELQSEDERADSESRSVFSEVGLHIRRAVELLNDTLALCRKDLRVRPTLVDAASILEDPRALWRLMLAHRGVAFAVSCAPGVSLRADAKSLDRALHNLTRNAADAVSGRPGARVEVGARGVDDGAELWVSDNGPGVPASLLASLFEPFATAGKEGGTGFGLAIVQQIAEAHGGRVRYDRVDDMSRFTIFLPSQHDAQTDAQNPS
jgi:two-component system, NtrC family, sensor kinase